MERNYNALLLNDKDNVAVVLKSLRAGDKLIIQNNERNLSINVDDNIPYGHKVAIDLIPKDGKVIKYGECMGIAKKRIVAGSHVHLSNVRGLTERDKQIFNY